MRTRTFLPRPEYPRPERQRGFVEGVDWLNLNGAWEFSFDPERVGLDQQWYGQIDIRWSDQIIVPFCWESLAAWGEADAAGNDNFFSIRAYRNPLEVTMLNYRSAARHEVGWYKRIVRIPANEYWANKRVVLTVGAADFFTRAWCNGREIGSHEGGFTPFEFDLTETLLPAENGERIASLVLRVEDPMRNEEQPVGKQWGWYSSASGIWQTVFLEPRAAEFIERFEITTDIGKAEVSFQVFVSGGTNLALEIASPTGELFDATITFANGSGSCTVPMGSAILWDPNSPQLYRVKLMLGNDGTGDVVHSYFGMRSLATRSPRHSSAPSALTLNGDPIYLRGALYQSYYPEGVYTAGDVQAIQEDILQAKKAGFDLLRVHIKVDDPLVYYYADVLGILLMADFPNFGEGGDTALGRQRYEEMMRRTIARDFNHPSIVAWCLFNETWGFGGQAAFIDLINPTAARAEMMRPEPAGAKLSNEKSYTWIQSMWQLAKSLDSTRLVEDMSVVAWEHLQYYGHGATDVNSWHFYTGDYEIARRQIREVVEKTYAGSTFNYVPGFKQKSQPLIASEYGGVSALEGDIDTSWSFKFLTNELRRYENLSAYIYTELHDVEWERNGFLNYDRTPKEFGYDPTMVNQGDVLPIDSPPIRRCRPAEEITVEVSSSHFSRRKRDGVTLDWHLSGIDSLGWMYDDLVCGREPISFPHLRVELAKRLRLRLPEKTMLCTLWVRASVADGTVVAKNYVQFFVDGGAPEREENASRLILRLSPSAWSAADWSGGSCTQDEAKETGSCDGRGSGFFEWKFPLRLEELHRFSRLSVICEASAFREGHAQTDSSAQLTAMSISLNGVPIYRTTLPNHPHDARGALSYLGGGRGAYGYLTHARLEGALLHEVVRQMEGNYLRLRCSVLREEECRGGLTIYGLECGRYPLGPTVIAE